MSPARNPIASIFRHYLTNLYLKDIMTSRTIKRICLSCRHYRPTDEARGKCRLEKGNVDPSAYPVMNHEQSCESWQDVGQKYHIRVGWIRGLLNKAEGDAEAASKEDK